MRRDRVPYGTREPMPPGLAASLRVDRATHGDVRQVVERAYDDTGTLRAERIQTHLRVSREPSHAQPDPSRPTGSAGGERGSRLVEVIGFCLGLAVAGALLSLIWTLPRWLYGAAVAVRLVSAVWGRRRRW